MKKYSILLLFALAWTACSDFLEPKSQTEYVPRTISALNELLIGEAYLNPATQNSAFFAYNEILSDDWACTVEDVSYTGNQNNYIIYKPLFGWHPDMFRLLDSNNRYNFNVWRDCYKLILGCNAVLDYLEEMDGSVEEKSYVRAQALALRAFYYFHLVNLFGEPYSHNKDALGVPLKLDSDMKADYPVRASVQMVYRQVVADLEKAEADFMTLRPDAQFVKDGRVTLPMVQLLKARVALFMEDYDTAITYAGKVIDNWGLQLLDLNSVVSNEAVPYYLYTSYDNPEALWLFTSSYDASRFSDEIIHLDAAGKIPRKMFNASESLLASYDADDMRKDFFILKESPTVSNYIACAKIPVNVDYSKLLSEFGRAFRLSEAYLMLVEALYHKGDENAAVNLLEVLRQKRYKNTGGDLYKVPVPSASGEALLNFIKAERRREMCFEGLRWFDLRRWGMDGFSRDWKEEGEVVATFTMEKNDPAFTLPIPFDAIEKNPNLVQNGLSTPKY